MKAKDQNAPQVEGPTEERAEERVGGHRGGHGGGHGGEQGGGHADKAAQSPIEAVWTYHLLSRHRADGYAPSPGFLDWDSQPNPFRRFVGTETTPLAFAPDGPGADILMPPVAVPTLEGVGAFLELAAGLSSWKEMDGARWAQRNVPSSGNLHPCEVTLVLLRPVAGDGAMLAPGVYRYDPHDHLLECRRVYSPDCASALMAVAGQAWGVFGVSLVPWREEWKYGARAFRYCELDCGHLLGSALAAALALGPQGDGAPMPVWLDPRPSDAQIAALLGLDDAASFEGVEPERPGFMAWLGGGLDTQGLPDLDTFFNALQGGVSPWMGTASRVSAETVKWPEVAMAETATRKTKAEVHLPLSDGAASTGGSTGASTAASTGGSTGGLRGRDLSQGRPRPWLSPGLIRQRRSVQRMDPKGTLSLEALRACARRLTPMQDASFWAGFPLAPAVQPVLLVHGVEGLSAGVYALNRDPDVWQKAVVRLNNVPEPVPEVHGLYRLGPPRSVRKEASQTSCYQGIAGRGAVTWIFLGDMSRLRQGEEAAPWAYRWLHWEAGLMGQALYLTAEEYGFRGTGIGCFLDQPSATIALGDGVGLAGTDTWQTLYHFTVGQALPDARMVSTPPYAHLSDARRAGG